MKLLLLLLLLMLMTMMMMVVRMIMITVILVILLFFNIFCLQALCWRTLKLKIITIIISNNDYKNNHAISNMIYYTQAAQTFFGVVLAAFTRPR